MGDEYFQRHRDRRALFGDDVCAYDLGRPGYPERVYELLRERGGLHDGSRVLEIGPGTGQATQRLLDIGASVTTVELSAALADLLTRKHPAEALDVKVGAFEDVDLPAASFDLVVAATSFHWIEAEAGVKRCADLLRVGGSLALWWNVFGDPRRPDPFHDALTTVLRPLGPDLLDVPGMAPDAPPPYALDTAARSAEIQASGRFGRVHHEIISWTGRHTPEQIRALFGSYSPWLALPTDRRRVLLDELERIAVADFGGTVERPYLTSVYIASKL